MNAIDDMFNRAVDFIRENIFLIIVGIILFARRTYLMLKDPGPIKGIINKLFKPQCYGPHCYRESRTSINFVVYLIRISWAKSVAHHYYE